MRRKLRRRLRSDCQGKQVYTWDGARRVAARLRQRGTRNLSAYRCAYCDGWHIGHELSQTARRAERP